MSSLIWQLVEQDSLLTLRASVQNEGHNQSVALLVY
jgi:hypothetical protein